MQIVDLLGFVRKGNFISNREVHKFRLLSFGLTSPVLSLCFFLLFGPNSLAPLVGLFFEANSPTHLLSCSPLFKQDDFFFLFFFFFPRSALPSSSHASQAFR